MQCIYKNSDIPILSVTAGGVTLSILVDSGSSVSLVVSNRAEALILKGFVPIQANLVCQGLNGGYLTLDRALRIPLDNFPAEIIFFICPASFQADLLLGSEDLARLNAKLDFTKRLVSFPKGISIPFLPRCLTHREAVRVVLSESVTIPARHYISVKARVPHYEDLDRPIIADKETLSFEVRPVGHGTQVIPFDQLNPPPSCSNEGAETDLILFNLTNSERSFRKGTCMAKARLVRAKADNLKDAESVFWMKHIPFSEERFGKVWEAIPKDHIPSEEIPSLRKLIREFADVFSLNDFELGRTDWLELELDTGNHQPCKDKRWPMSAPKREFARQKIAELLQAGIIRKVDSSPYLANLVIVPKGKSGFRMAVDYRSLNKITTPLAMPAVHIPELLDSLAGKRIFSVCDLKAHRTD